MKTAAQWVKEQSTIKGVLGNLTVDITRQIQRDALNEAAGIARSHEVAGGGAICYSHNMACHEISRKIINIKESV